MNGSAMELKARIHEMLDTQAALERELEQAEAFIEAKGLTGEYLEFDLDSEDGD